MGGNCSHWICTHACTYAESLYRQGHAKLWTVTKASQKLGEKYFGEEIKFDR